MTSFIQTPVVSTNLGLEHTAPAAIPFVTGYNSQMEILIGSYLGRQVEGMAKENSSNQALAQLAKIYAAEDAACLRHGFDERMIAVFRKNGLSLWRLPIFDLTTPVSHGISWGPKDLPVQEDGRELSLFRFKEAEGRGLGIMVNIETKWQLVRENDAMPDRSIFKIYSPNLRAPGKENLLWRNNGEWTEVMGRRYVGLYFKTGEHLRNSSATDQHPRFYELGPRPTEYLARFIQNEDPLFKLVGEIAQIAHPLPALEAPVEAQPQAALQQPVAQPQQPQASNSWLSGVGAFIRRNLGLE